MPTRCPDCDARFERVSQHWSRAECGYPMLSVRQRAILRGLMLAGATVAGNGRNRNITIGTTSEPLAEWIADQLGWLCHGIREEPETGSRNTIFRVRTPAHPVCNQFERWEKLPGNSGRAMPADLVLDRTTARVWWAVAGGLEWSGPYSSQRKAAFSAKEETKAVSIKQVLSQAGYDPNRVGRRIQLSSRETNRWINWLGEPVPGSEHKWAESIIVYRALRTEPRSQTEYDVALSRAAVEVALERTDKRPLTQDVFDSRINEIDSEDVAAILGGGDWEDALSTVVERPEVSAIPNRDGDYRHGEAEDSWVTETVRDRAITQAAAECGEPLSLRAYQEWTADQHDVPSGHTISDKWGWVESCEAVGVEPAGRRAPTLRDLLTAVTRMHDEIGHWPTITEYKEQKQQSEPSHDWFYRTDPGGLESWSDVIDTAKDRVQRNGMD